MVGGRGFDGAGGNADVYDFDASRVVATANENRPRNISWVFIIYTGA